MTGFIVGDLVMRRDWSSHVIHTVEQVGDTRVWLRGVAASVPSHSIRPATTFEIAVFPRADQPAPIVHCGVPYVARSEYERVCRELEELKAAQKPVTPEVPIPKPPAFLRVGWWYAMDSSGEWYAFNQKPKLYSACWDTSDFRDNYCVTDAMECLAWPRERWDEACWQVTE